MVARLVVAAPASGHGKTSIATGLLAAFGARGLTTSPHKVGPDYIDPGYHARASGRPGRNLDPWLVGEERIAPLFLHGAHTPRPADVAVVEGVMGLYDGAAGSEVPVGFASTAHIAALLQAPVLLVVDASRAGRSVAALVHGFATYQPDTWIAGVILNRVGSPRHQQILTEALDGIGMPVLGAVRRHEAVETPSRHLGLVPAAELGSAADRVVRTLGDIVASSVDLEAVLRVARSAPRLRATPWNPDDEVGSAPALGRPRVAVAGGAAFSFSYPEHAELLAAVGAEVVPVDPLADRALPEGTRALVLGGGFPEMHAQQLSANASLRADVARLASSGAPIAAECAGLLYLTRSLDGAPMCGVLDAHARMTDRLTLAYREAVAASSSVLVPAGARVRGHEFHRTTCTPRAGDAAGWASMHDGDAAGPDGSEGFVAGGVHASYLHLHWAGCPGIATRLLASLPSTVSAEAGR